MHSPEEPYKSVLTQVIKRQPDILSSGYGTITSRKHHLWSTIFFLSRLEFNQASSLYLKKRMMFNDSTGERLQSAKSRFTWNVMGQITSSFHKLIIWRKLGRREEKNCRKLRVLRDTRPNEIHESSLALDLNKPAIQRHFWDN